MRLRIERSQLRMNNIIQSCSYKNTRSLDGINVPGLNENMPVCTNRSVDSIYCSQQVL